jgi:hypothetical protein
MGEVSSASRAKSRSAALSRRRGKCCVSPEDAKLMHGYLENQVFSSAVQRGKDIVWRRVVPVSGRPYLARAAEEHSGPHMPCFGRRSGKAAAFFPT